MAAAGPSTSRASISFEPLYLIDFGMDNIMSYCDFVSTTQTPDIPVNYLKVNQKASSMCKEKYVSNIEFCDKDDFFDIYAKVKAEMKKKTVYSVYAKITKNNEVSMQTLDPII